MTSVFKNKEIQLGLIILFTFYVSAIIYNVDLNMIYSHETIAFICLFMLIILLLNFRVILAAPHQGLLRLISKEDIWFINSYKIIFFIMFFTICTFIFALISHALYLDRSQDIFTLGMFITNIYYLILAFWISYNFVIMSAVGNNMKFNNE